MFSFKKAIDNCLSSSCIFRWFPTRYENVAYYKMNAIIGILRKDGVARAAIPNSVLTVHTVSIVSIITLAMGNAISPVILSFSDRGIP